MKIAYDQRDGAAATAAASPQPIVIVGGPVRPSPSDAQRMINPERAAAAFPAPGGG